MTRYSLAFTEQTQLEFVWTTANYAQIATDPIYRSLRWKSIRLALVVTAIALVLGYPAAWAIARSSDRHKSQPLALLIVPWWASYIVQVFGMCMAFGRGGITNVGLQWLEIFNHNFLGIALTEANLYLPLMIIPIYMTVERMNMSVIQAERSLGSRPLRTFIRVILPLSLRGILTGCIFVFLPVTGTFVAPSLVGGLHDIMFGNLIASQFGESFNWPQGAALAMVLLLLIATLRVMTSLASRVSGCVEHTLAMVELESLGKRRPHQLSGGQQQRVALARAVVIEPDVLLLDEPLGALDKKLRENMQLRLMELHRALNITTIYVTHDQEEELTMSDRIAVMNSDVHGIVQLDTPYELYQHPSSLFVANFIGASSTLQDPVIRRARDMLLTARGFMVDACHDAVIAAGDAVALAVRPEHLTIQHQGETATAPSHLVNLVAGEVSGVVFLGDATTYLVQTAEEQLRVKQFQASNGAHLQVGDLVTVSWRPEDARAFSAGTP